MEKRGVSPLIATILLVGITVAVSVIVFTFVRNIAEEKVSETEVQTNIALACSQNVKLEYDDPFPCGSGSNLKVSVWNKGPLDIIDLKIQILGGSSSYLYPGEGSDPVTLDSYNKNLYDITNIGFDVGEIDKINLIPTIEINEVTGSCSPTVIEIEVEGCGEDL